MSNLQEDLFHIIDVIVDNKVKEVKTDRTIECLITDDTEANLGKYKAKYQDVIFPVYSTTSSTKYKVNENVLVSVPDGDMSAKKTIISSSKNEGEKYVDVTDVINKVGVNFVDELDNFEINLSTNTVLEEVPFKIKKDLMVDMYLGQKMLLIGAEIESQIDARLATNGDYGIEINCKFVGIDAIQTFAFRLGDMTGNPYASRGYKYIKIPLLENRLLDVVSAKAYSKNMTDPNGYIKIKNLEIEYIRLVEADKSPYTGNILTPKGNYFKGSILEPNEYLPLVMELKREGAILDTKEVAYEWYIMDAAVNSVDSPGYNPNAGFGWRQLNEQDKTQGYITSYNTKDIQIRSTFVPNFATFKGIAIYKNEYSASSQITLIDNTEVFITEIDSSNGNSFKNGVGNTTLTCIINKNGEIYESSELIYKWSKIDSRGVTSLIKQGKEKTLIVYASDIDEKSIFICEIILNSVAISSGAITLINLIDGTTKDLIIIGGFRTAMYDGAGKLPSDFIKKIFSYELYRGGEKVPVDNIISQTWSIPPDSSSLLIMDNTFSTNPTTQFRETTDTQLTLGLKSNFNISQSDNYIILEVRFSEGGVESTARETINISISKLGETGATGAGTDGKTYVYEIQGGTPTLYYPGTGILPELERVLNPFYLTFYEDGNDVTKNVEMVKWTIPSNSLLAFRGSAQKYQITMGNPNLGENPHTVVLEANANWDSTKLNNYLKAEITYNGKTAYVELYPIAVSRGGSDALKIELNPNQYSVSSQVDGNITKPVSILINLDIYKNEIKIEDYYVSSIGNTPLGMIANVAANGKDIEITFQEGKDLPDDGIIEIGVVVNNVLYKRNFNYNKVRQGESPYLLILQSTNGLVFKGGDISTTIYAVVMKGSEIVTDTIPETAFQWQKLDKDGNIIQGWTPTYVANEKDKIVITPSDIVERATFNCILSL